MKLIVVTALLATFSLQLVAAEQQVIHFASPGLSTIAIRLPSEFVETGERLFPSITREESHSDTYCHPDDSRIVLARSQTELPRLGCVFIPTRIVEIPGAQTPWPLVSFNKETERFGYQDVVDELLKHPERSPGTRIFNVERRDVRGIPIFSYSEERTVHGNSSTMHVLWLFDGSHAWNVGLMAGHDKAAAEALWKSILSGL